MLELCRPGIPVCDLSNAADGVSVDGVGIGHEELGDDDVLEAGMVLTIERTAADVLSGETLIVTPDGFELLKAPRRRAARSRTPSRPPDLGLAVLAGGIGVPARSGCPR